MSYPLDFLALNLEDYFKYFDSLPLNEFLKCRNTFYSQLKYIFDLYCEINLKHVYKKKFKYIKTNNFNNGNGYESVYTNFYNNSGKFFVYNLNISNEYLYNYSYLSHITEINFKKCNLNLDALIGFENLIKLRVELCKIENVKSINFLPIKIVSVLNSELEPASLKLFFVKIEEIICDYQSMNYFHQNLFQIVPKLHLYFGNSNKMDNFFLQNFCTCRQHIGRFFLNKKCAISLKNLGETFIDNIFQNKICLLKNITEIAFNKPIKFLSIEENINSTNFCLSYVKTVTLMNLWTPRLLSHFPNVEYLSFFVDENTKKYSLFSLFLYCKKLKYVHIDTNDILKFYKKFDFILLDKILKYIKDDRIIVFFLKEKVYLNIIQQIEQKQLQLNSIEFKRDGLYFSNAHT